MKNLVRRLLHEIAILDLPIDDKSIIKGQFNIVGSCMDFTVQLPNGDGSTLTWQTTCQKTEIVCVLQRMGAIRGFDLSTGLAYTQRGHAKHLWEVLETVGELPLQLELLTHHLTCALHILDYDGEVEDLVYLFQDFSIIEKCAWLHRMAQLPSIKLNSARNVVNNLMNYHDRTITTFPTTVANEVQFFARWMERNPHNLFTLCNPVAALQLPYVTTVS